jgi:hypothetical protein
VSVVAGPRQETPDAGPREGRIGTFKVDTIDPREAVGLLEQAGYEVLWPQ